MTLTLPPDTVAIVTGVGREPATAVAKALAAAGARVALIDLNPDFALRVAEEIRAAGGEALDVTADVASRFQCANAIEAIRAQWGRLDILVNGTAVVPHTPILKMDEWEWTRCHDVNLKGAFFMSQLCGRVMAEENQAGGGGTIINLAATAALVSGETTQAAFVASQAGLLGFARECAREFAPHGIRVNTILTGNLTFPVEADITPLSVTDLPDDVAGAVVALSTAGGQATTGRVFVTTSNM